MLSEQLIFILNNVKGLQGGDKKIELSEYVNTCIHFNGYFLLQETHSSQNDENNGLMNFSVWQN